MFYFTVETQEFPWVVTLNSLSMGTVCRPTNIHSVLCFLPFTRKHLWSNLVNSCADSAPQVLQISCFFCVHHFHGIPPEEKNQEQLNPGFRDCISSTWLWLTNTLCFFELFEPAADVVHMRSFTTKFIPELTLNIH